MIGQASNPPGGHYGNLASTIRMRDGPTDQRRESCRQARQSVRRSNNLLRLVRSFPIEGFPRQSFLSHGLELCGGDGDTLEPLPFISPEIDPGKFGSHHPMSQVLRVSGDFD